MSIESSILAQFHSQNKIEFIILIMLSLFFAFSASFIANLLIIRFKHLHGHYSGDNDLSGPQKFHAGLVPRIGGIGILIGVLVATLMHLDTGPSVTNFVDTILLCSIATFFIGLTEDLTKKISIRVRLLFTALSAGLAVHYLGAQIPRMDILGIDYLLNIPLVSILFTIFAITGLSNAYNIIDGFNGLSSMVGIITLIGLAYVSSIVGDTLITHLSLVMASSIMGFFIWNYPKGLIFLGDGGAYLIGYWIALLSILLVVRHSEISPWFALLINSYPIFETLFSIYRRMIYQSKNPGRADGMHFHTLIYRRILNSSRIKNINNLVTSNAKTAPYLWALNSVAIIPALLWWQSTPLLIISEIVFITTYVCIYKNIVNFRAPKWMRSFDNKGDNK